MSNINFDNPYLLLIAVPLIVLFTVPFVLAVRKDNRNAHNVTSQVMHVLLAIIIAFAAAGTSIVTVLTQTHVYVVADVSYSANKNLDTIDNIIRDQLKLPRNSKVGIVTFGKNYELLCELSDQKDLKSVKEYTVDDSETNIAEALEYAGTLFDSDDVVKRVVLITDGRQTDEVDTSAMRRAVDTLISNDIKVDAYFLDDNLNSGTPEVQISGAEFTGSAFINHKEYVNVIVQSTVETNALIYLYKNGEEIEIPDHSVSLTAGNNSVSLPLDTSVSGTYDYEVRIRAIPEENDASNYNNNYKFTQTVSSDLKVLIVTNEWDDCRELVKQYEGSASIDVFENSGVAISSKRSFYTMYMNNDDVNIYCFRQGINEGTASNNNITLRNVPSLIEEICKYDEIVLSNLDIRTIPDVTKFVESLDIAVGTFGKSLVTLGNTYTQSIGKDEKELKSLSNMLPVRFGQTEDAPKLYTIIIDASRSMFMGSQTSKINLAKKYVEKLLGTLNYGDQLIVVGFYGDAWQIYQDKFTDVAAVMREIDKIEVKQGTVLSGALNMAYNTITPLKEMYGDKQLMIITDGKDSSSDYEKSKQLVSEMYDDSIVTSVIQFYRSSEPSSATQNSMKFSQDIANLGHGNFFPVDADLAEPPDDVTFGQMADQMGDKIVDGRDTNVIVIKKNDDVLANVPDILLADKNTPDVYGYYVSAAKASATSVLQVRHKKSETKDADLPLYAYWNYGNGRVSSFTSSITGDWMKYWKGVNIESSNKNLYSTFMYNVMYVNIPNEKADYPYALSVVRDGSATQVLVTPHQKNLNFSAVAQIKLVLPDGNIVNESLILDKDHYYYNFKSAEVGRYQIEVTYSYNNADYKAVSVFNVSYTSEYDEFASFEASPLFRALNGRGQVILEGDLLLVNDEHEMGTYTNDFTIPLLIMAVVLFVVDIIIRKLKWEDIVSFFGGFKKPGGKKA